jgi:Putative antitoxin
MRTTIELSDRHRAGLLALKAERGDTSFSSIVQEALDLYFEIRKQRQGKVDRALAAIGSLDEAAAQELERTVREARNSWR